MPRLRLCRRPTSSGRTGWSRRRAACCGSGEPVPLTPKAFDTLLALVERRDRVVDKAELMRLVWPDSFVEEANLSQTIFVLRKTLGEGPDGRPSSTRCRAVAIASPPTCGPSRRMPVEP